MKKVQLSTGRVQSLCEAPVGRGGAWSPAGVIIFGESHRGIFQVPDTGGTPVVVTHPPPDASYTSGQRYPEFLPDGRHFLYLYLGETGMPGIYVGSLDGSEPVRVLETQELSRFAPATTPGEPGHLLFRR